MNNSTWESDGAGRWSKDTSSGPEELCALGTTVTTVQKTGVTGGWVRFYSV